MRGGYNGISALRGYTVYPHPADIPYIRGNNLPVEYRNPTAAIKLLGELAGHWLQVQRPADGTADVEMQDAGPDEAGGPPDSGGTMQWPELVDLSTRLAETNFFVPVPETDSAGHDGPALKFKTFWTRGTPPNPRADEVRNYFTNLWVAMGSPGEPAPFVAGRLAEEHARCIREYLRDLGGNSSQQHAGAHPPGQQ